MRKKPSRRNGWYYRDGKEFRSITTMLGETLPTPRVHYWRTGQCVDLALKNLSDSMDDPERLMDRKEVMAQFQLQMRETQDRGKYVHRVAYLLSQDVRRKDQVLAEAPEEYRGYIEGLVSFFETHRPKMISQEKVVFSEKYMLAGRYDLLAYLDEELWVLDFKTNESGEVFLKSQLQCRFYKEALKEDQNILAVKAGIVNVTSTGNSSLTRISVTQTDLQDAVMFWRMLKRRKGL